MIVVEANLRSVVRCPIGVNNLRGAKGSQNLSRRVAFDLFERLAFFTPNLEPWALVHARVGH